MTKQKYVSNTEGGFEVGDIVAGNTRWGCTTPYFYKVIRRKGKTQFELESLNQGYSPSMAALDYETVPIEYYKGPGLWHVFTDFKPKKIIVRVLKFEKDGLFEESYNLYPIGDAPKMLLYKWDGKPMHGNSD